MANINWVVCYDGTHPIHPYAFECLRCGAVQQVTLPIEVSHYVKQADDFLRCHRHCQETEATGQAQR
jgi:hypothetical protein